MKLFTILLDLLYPPKCVFCAKILKDNETDICNKCRIDIPEISGTIRRGEGNCECYSVYDYKNTVATSIRRFKFHGQQQYSTAYARCIAMKLLREHAEFDVLSWVPISDKRAKERGYRQSKLLAEAVAQELRIEAIQTLRKIRDNPAQSSMKSAAARTRNVKNAYEAISPEHFSGKRVLLIDDVVTSGATLSECSSALQKAGAQSVICATLAAVGI